MSETKPLNELLDEIDQYCKAATLGPWMEGQDGNLRVYGPDGAGDDFGLIAVVYKGRDNRKNDPYRDKKTSP